MFAKAAVSAFWASPAQVAQVGSALNLPFTSTLPSASSVISKTVALVGTKKASLGL